MTALNTISDAYGSSSADDEDSEADERVTADGKGLGMNPGKRKCEELEGLAKAPRGESMQMISVHERLPMPLELSGMFEDGKADDSNAEEHQNRIRSFPHERGNWATYVYFPYITNAAFEELVEKVLESSGKLLQPIDDFHISLSRTVVLRHHWIQPFVESLTQLVRHVSSFFLTFHTFGLYTNEENTRTFLGLKVGAGEDKLHQLVLTIDNCLNDFKLPTFYKDPSFHMSIGWCLGDKRKELSGILPALQDHLDSFCNSSFEGLGHSTVQLTSVHCKSGNRIFPISLHPF